MTMNRTQQMVFCEDAVPMIFHHSPRQFLNYLDRDGNKFLHFYWNQVAKNLAIDAGISAFGLNYVIKEPVVGTTVVMVILPVPQVEGEAHYLGLVYQPRRIRPFVRLSSRTNVLALVKTGDHDEDQQTTLIETLRNGKKTDHGRGPDPNIDEFYRRTLALMGIRGKKNSGMMNPT
jgi:hypothetical protein